MLVRWVLVKNIILLGKLLCLLYFGINNSINNNELNKKIFILREFIGWSNILVYMMWECSFRFRSMIRSDKRFCWLYFCLDSKILVDI